MAGLVPKRYAKALFELAVESNKVEIMEQEISQVKSIFINEPDFIQLLNHPKINLQEKTNALEEVFSQKISREIMGLMILLVQKKRQGYIDEIFSIFLDEVKAYKNIVTASVASAVELNEEDKHKLQQKLETTLNKKVELELEVDKDIIGGLVIRVGDKVFDNSIRSKLRKLSSSLNNLQLS